MGWDYRDHNQDDSDSSEHNKSVQVESEEEEEEPLRRTEKKPMGKKAPAKRWSDEEEVALAKSWLTISENPDVGNAQKRMVFIEKKWNEFYQQASMNRKSGEGDEQVLKKAMKNYKSVVKSKGFAHIQAWEMVRDNSL
ncbi:hypothetical protein R6Q57_026468 [Mikania cordata]